MARGCSIIRICGAGCAASTACPALQRRDRLCIVARDTSDGHGTGSFRAGRQNRCHTRRLIFIRVSQRTRRRRVMWLRTRPDSRERERNDRLLPHHRDLTGGATKISRHRLPDQPSSGPPPDPERRGQPVPRWPRRPPYSRYVRGGETTPARSGQGPDWQARSDQGRSATARCAPGGRVTPGGAIPAGARNRLCPAIPPHEELDARCTGPRTLRQVWVDAAS